MAGAGAASWAGRPSLMLSLGLISLLGLFFFSLECKNGGTEIARRVETGFETLKKGKHEKKNVVAVWRWWE
jgi:hypothetical protein